VQRRVRKGQKPQRGVAEIAQRRGNLWVLVIGACGPLDGTRGQAVPFPSKESARYSEQSRAARPLDTVTPDPGAEPIRRMGAGRDLRRPACHVCVCPYVYLWRTQKNEAMGP
jgi:hypothetical protein